MAYKLIEGGGVTTPQGFLAGACYVGVKSRKSEKPDVAIIYSEQPAVSYTHLTLPTTPYV